MDRDMNILSFGGEVLMFQCKSLSSGSQRAGSEVSLSSLTFNPNTQSFSSKDHTIYPLHRDKTSEVDIVHSSAVLDVQQRRKVPFVLLKLYRKRTSAFRYILYSVNNPTETKIHFDFVLAYQIRDHVSILRGPTLVWCHDVTVYYISSQTHGVKEISLPMTVSFIGHLPLSQNKLVVLGVQKSPDEAMKNTLYFLDDDRSVNGNILVPDAYSEVIRCVTVLSAEERDGSLGSSLLTVTGMKQLVSFENGVPLDVCFLPYDHPLKIQTLHTVRNDLLIIITFSHGNVCAVWKDTLQVCCCWTDVRLILVDDFLGCGTDQMLLVFGGSRSSGELLSNFLLTDLCGITYTCGEGNGKMFNMSSQENYLFTIRALESRLQSGLNFLEDLQRDVNVKEKLINQTLTALTDLISDREHVISSPEQEGLVSLWDDDDDDGGDEELRITDEKMQIECDEDLMKVNRVWQRVIGERLICGVVMTITDIRYLKNFSASLLSDCPVTVNNRILLNQSLASDTTDCCDPPPLKNIRRSNDIIRSTEMTLMMITDLPPLITSGSIRCPIVINYTHRTSSSDQPARVSHHGQQITVNLKDLSMGKLNPRLLHDNKLKTEESKEDLLSLTAATNSWCFLIGCRDHTLVDVQGWLLDVMHAERLEAEPNYITHSSASLISHWTQKTPFQGLLTLYYRDELHLLQFLNWLCDFLPVSHHVRFLRTPTSRRNAGGFSQTLETEIQDVTRELFSLLQCEEREVKRGEMRDSSVPLERLREEWRIEKEKFDKRIRPLLDRTRYSTIINRLIDTQMKSDVIALTETHVDTEQERYLL